MDENLVLGPISAHLAQIWAPNIFLNWFYLNLKLNIIASYHCIWFQGKLKNQTWEKMAEILILDQFWSKFGPQNVFAGFY